jgi:hypothetical protein
MERSLIEEFLTTDEQILWIARPDEKSFKIKNIRLALFDFIKQIMVLSLFLWIYDIICHRQFFMETDLRLLIWSVPVLFLISTISVIIKIARVDKIYYCLTDRRVLVFANIEKLNLTLKTIDKQNIKKKEKTATAIERKYNVHTIKLGTGDPDLDLQLESIDNNFDV